MYISRLYYKYRAVNCESVQSFDNWPMLEDKTRDKYKIQFIFWVRSEGLTVTSLKLFSETFHRVVWRDIGPRFRSSLPSSGRANSSLRWGSKLLWNVDQYLPDHTVEHPWRQIFSNVTSLTRYRTQFTPCYFWNTGFWTHCMTQDSWQKLSVWKMGQPLRLK